MPNEQGKGMRRSIAAASSGRLGLARCAAGRRSVSRRFSHSIAQNHSHRRNCRPPAVRAPPPPPPLPARMSASNHISSCTSVWRHWLLEPPPLRLAVPPPASLPPSLPLTAIYPSLIGLRNLSRTGKDEASEGGSERTNDGRDRGTDFYFRHSLPLFCCSIAATPRPARKVGM